MSVLTEAFGQNSKTVCCTATNDRMERLLNFKKVRFVSKACKECQQGLYVSYCLLCCHSGLWLSFLINVFMLLFWHLFCLFSFWCLVSPSSWAFLCIAKEKNKKQTKCTVVGRQAVHESFIIVEAMAVRTQGVEFSWNEKHKQYILLSHSAHISQHFLKCPTITTVQSSDIFSNASCS